MHRQVIDRAVARGGEILGGLVLGPTIFGALLPALHAQVFPDAGASAAALAGIYQLGLLLLMFAAGAELRSVFHRKYLQHPLMGYPGLQLSRSPGHLKFCKAMPSQRCSSGSSKPMSR